MVKKTSYSIISVTLIILLMVSLFPNFKYTAVNTSTPINGNVKLKNSIYSFFDSFKHINQKNEDNSSEKRELVYFGGDIIGIKIYCDGVIIVATDDVETPDGKVNPAKTAGLKVGDIIKRINNTKVYSNNDVSEIIKNSDENEIIFDIVRNEKEQKISFFSAKDISGVYRAGLWVRDSSAGIGTVSFYTEDGYFGSLGHGICDIDTGEVLPLGKGTTTEATLTGVYKGSNGCAGELCGVLDSKNNGRILENGATGIYGVTDNFIPDETRKIQLAFCDEIKKGSAYIISTVEEGCTEKYNVEITNINFNSQENKNMTVKVTDSGLLEKTGGIVQGMSGSPIIQNGKLIGAVTHVLVDDPTTGYAIFAENMLETLESVASSEKLRVAS